MTDCPVVDTSLGKAKGRVLAKATCDDAKQVFAYLGVPFAKPPIGELRFEPPQDAEPWKGILDATKTPPGPIQSAQLVDSLTGYAINIKVADEDLHNTSEDCLYLNVYTNNPNNKANMPVMIWFFGGGFFMGSSDGYHGQVLCGLQDVVLVVPNYRVNVFGWFSMGKNSKYTGNMGLLDQIKAMEWTRDHIRSFGGDPNNVTIFGESAGAASVHCHVLSPMSRGLFHKAISHSGVITSGKAVKENPEDACAPFLEALGIKETEPDIVMKKLKSLPAKDLLDATDKIMMKMVYFWPGVDGKMFSKSPLQMLADADFAPVPYIIGINSTEGRGVLASRHPPSFQEGFTENEATDMVKMTVQMMEKISPEKMEEVVSKAKEVYMKFYEKDDKMKWSKFASDIAADSAFGSNSIAAATAHAGAGHTTYVYCLEQQLQIHHNPESSKGLKMKHEFCEADHGDDIIFTFGNPFCNWESAKDFKYTDEEKELCLRWMEYLVSFARTGNPNSNRNSKEWPRYKNDKRQHLVVKMPLGEGSDLLLEKSKFWNETFPRIIAKQITRL